MTLDSWQSGWRSLLLRGYVDPAVAAEFNTLPTPDHLIVLVTEGACDVEGRHGGRWRKAHYEAGSIGMTAPSEEVTLRWHGTTQHKTLQLHLPASALEDAMADLAPRSGEPPSLPHVLHAGDPLIERMMLTLAEAMRAGAPDLYAETAASFLAVHLLVRHGRLGIQQCAPTRDDRRLARVETFMRDHLAMPLTLAEMAREAGVSRFHLLRLFKDAHGETPFRRLTRMRMEEAQRRLSRGAEPICQIAFACGYQNPAHFASAFRRVVGTSPGAYRRTSSRQDM